MGKRLIAAGLAGVLAGCMTNIRPEVVLREKPKIPRLTILADLITNSSLTIRQSTLEQGRSLIPLGFSGEINPDLSLEECGKPLPDAKDAKVVRALYVDMRNNGWSTGDVLGLTLEYPNDFMAFYAFQHQGNYAAPTLIATKICPTLDIPNLAENLVGVQDQAIKQLRKIPPKKEKVGTPYLDDGSLRLDMG